MKSQNLLHKIFIGVLIASVASAVLAQTPRAPRQEQLLNGLKVLMWDDARADKVWVRVRVHSGSAFDPQGKEGVMQLLADNLFPNEGSREYFADNLGGSLEVITTYDYIQINASCKPESLLTMIETLATAVSNPAIDSDTTVKLRNALKAKVAALATDPTYVADQAVAKRLFGTFPYGRPQYGTSASLQKIDFADLIDAKARFLNADNATIALSGNYDKDLAYRAVRRYFGGWLKADKKSPSTFRQPDEPDTKPFGVTIEGTGNSAVRYALRGLARKDGDYVASEILTRIMRTRLRNFLPKEFGASSFVTNGVHVQPGIFALGYSSGDSPIAARPVTADSPDRPSGLPQNAAALLLSQTVSDAEFTTAKAELEADINRKQTADAWLDADTYKLISPTEDTRALRNVTAADVTRVAQRLAKNPIVTMSLIQRTSPKTN